MYKRKSNINLHFQCMSYGVLVMQKSMLYDEGECWALDSLLRLFEKLRMSNQGLLGESDDQ